MFKSIKEFEESKVEHQKKIAVLNKQKCNKAVRIMQLKQKAKLLTSWFFVTRFSATCRKREAIFHQKSKDGKMVKALTKWRDRNAITQAIRKKSASIKKNYNLRLMKSAIEAWKDDNLIQKTLVKSVCRLGKTLEDLDKLHAFTQIQHFGLARLARKEERKHHAAADIAYLLHLFYKNTLKSSLTKIQFTSIKIQDDQRLCRRVLLRAYLTKLKTAFLQWKLNHEKLTLANEINTEGEVAVEAERAHRRVEILKKFLIQNGHPAEDIEEELSNRKKKQNSLMRSFVIRCFFQTSEFSVVPKAFNQLKAWTRTRKLYKSAFDLANKYMNSEVFWAFKRWKHHHEDSRAKLAKISKTDLIKRCVDASHLLGSLQSHQEETNEHINLQLAERDQLLMHFASGQKIAFQRCEHKLRVKPLRKAFMKWQKNAFDQKLSETDAQIDKTQKIVAELMKILKQAEERNKDLLLENEELRQASLDGIEIAKAVQELTREREKLSKDLNSKNMAIQQLLDDNNAMSEKLNQY